MGNDIATLCVARHCRVSEWYCRSDAANGTCRDGRSCAVLQKLPRPLRNLDIGVNA